MNATSAPPLEGNSSLIPVAVVAAAVAGGVLWLLGAHPLADVAWALSVLVALVPLTATILPMWKKVTFPTMEGLS